jgi:hypothetical protein
MSRESLVFILGVLIFVTPFLGLPSEWKSYVFIACGVMLMILGFLLRRAAFFRSIETPSGERHAEAFAESSESVGEMDAADLPR